MKTSSNFNMGKDVKRMLCQYSSSRRADIKSAMIAAQVASEIRPKTREKKGQGASDE